MLPTVAISIVQPSGSAAAAAMGPLLPPRPPVMTSNSIDWPSTSSITGFMNWATSLEEPPGGKGKIHRIGLSGNAMVPLSV